MNKTLVDLVSVVSGLLTIVTALGAFSNVNISVTLLFITSLILLCLSVAVSVINRKNIKNNNVINSQTQIFGQGNSQSNNQNVR